MNNIDRNVLFKTFLVKHLQVQVLNKEADHAHEGPALSPHSLPVLEPTPVVINITVI